MGFSNNSSNGKFFKIDKETGLFKVGDDLFKSFTGELVSVIHRDDEEYGPEWLCTFQDEDGDRFSIGLKKEAIHTGSFFNLLAGEKEFSNLAWGCYVKKGQGNHTYYGVWAKKNNEALKWLYTPEQIKGGEYDVNKVVETMIIPNLPMLPSEGNSNNFSTADDDEVFNQSLEVVSALSEAAHVDVEKAKVIRVAAEQGLPGARQESLDKIIDWYAGFLRKLHGLGDPKKIEKATAEAANKAKDPAILKMVHMAGSHALSALEEKVEKVVAESGDPADDLPF